MASWFSGRRIWYRIECSECPYGVKLPTELQTPQVTISGLQEHTRYTVRIYTENDMTINNVGSAAFVSVDFVTEEKGKLI